MAALVFCLAAAGALAGVLLASLYDAFRRDERDHRSINPSESDR